MRLRNPLANAIHHGSAGDGVGHWWSQRLSAIFLIGLTAWLVWALLANAGQPHADIVTWLSHPFHAAMAGLFAVVALYHSRLGLQTIIEDYVHHRGAEVGLQVGVTVVTVVAMALAVLAVIQIALGATS
jgi:succinate dehydrogenase / fumarate reductase membrane anchor subunit